MLLPGAADAVKRLNEAGIPIAVITNQSIVGCGLITASELDAIHRRLEWELARAFDARLDLKLCQVDPHISGGSIARENGAFIASRG